MVYCASVTETLSGKTETYTGLTGRSFKRRLTEHRHDMKKAENRHTTSLSAHIWDLKDSGKDYQIKWRILARAPTFNPTSKKCRLCLREKYFIMYRKDCSTLNKRSEIFNTCRHRNQNLLSNVKT